MSRTIDQRVVEMQFDNRHFEQNVATSLSTLDKLKQKLNLTGASDGLNEISKASKKVDLSAIGNAVDAITPKFSFLYTFADQTFRNIVNAAESYAVKMAKAFTTDPIMTGLSEYETKINAPARAVMWQTQVVSQPALSLVSCLWQRSTCSRVMSR